MVRPSKSVLFVFFMYADWCRSWCVSHDATKNNAHRRNEASRKNNNNKCRSHGMRQHISYDIGIDCWRKVTRSIFLYTHAHKRTCQMSKCCMPPASNAIWAPILTHKLLSIDIVSWSAFVFSLYNFSIFFVFFITKLVDICPILGSSVCVELR